VAERRRLLASPLYDFVLRTQHRRNLHFSAVAFLRCHFISVLVIARSHTALTRALESLCTFITLPLRHFATLPLQGISK